MIRFEEVPFGIRGRLADPIVYPRIWIAFHKDRNLDKLQNGVSLSFLSRFWLVSLKLKWKDFVVGYGHLRRAVLDTEHCWRWREWLQKSLKTSNSWEDFTILKLLNFYNSTGQTWSLFDRINVLGIEKYSPSEKNTSYTMRIGNTSFLNEISCAASEADAPKSISITNINIKKRGILLFNRSLSYFNLKIEFSTFCALHFVVKFTESTPRLKVSTLLNLPNLT